MAYDYGCFDGALGPCYFLGIIKYKHLKYMDL